MSLFVEFSSAGSKMADSQRTPRYTRQIFQEPAESRSISHSKPYKQRTLLQRTLIIANTVFRNHTIICLEHLLLQNGHTNFGVNQETIIKQVHGFKNFQQMNRSHRLFHRHFSTLMSVQLLSFSMDFLWRQLHRSATRMSREEHCRGLATRRCCFKQ